jgi:hypothetical protein
LLQQMRGVQTAIEGAINTSSSSGRIHPNSVLPQMTL